MLIFAVAVLVAPKYSLEGGEKTYQTPYLFHFGSFKSL